MLGSNSNHKLDYDIFGPFKVPRKEAGYLDSDPKAKREFWQRVDQSEEGLSEACGCYVISVRNVVWYVGLTRKGFVCECFTPTKINKFDAAISEGKGDAYLHLLARRTPQGRFAKPSSNHRDIGKLEEMLIALALERNGHLLNKIDTVVLRRIVVPGIFNSPQGSARAKSVQHLKKALGIERLVSTNTKASKKRAGSNTWERGGTAKQRILRDKVAKAKDMKLAKSIGLGLMHYRVLRALDKNGDGFLPMTCEEIKDATGYFKNLGNLTHTDKAGNGLVTKGLAKIESKADETGREHVAFSITDKGRKLLDKASAQ